VQDQGVHHGTYYRRVPHGGASDPWIILPVTCPTAVIRTT
jgi:hypothetical protein